MKKNKLPKFNNLQIVFKKLLLITRYIMNYIIDNIYILRSNILFLCDDIINYIIDNIHNIRSNILCSCAYNINYISYIFLFVISLENIATSVIEYLIYGEMFYNLFDIFFIFTSCIIWLYLIFGLIDHIKCENFQLKEDIKALSKYNRGSK